jgi:hypothetical protein
MRQAKTALDDAIASDSTGAWPEPFEQLDSLLNILGGKGVASAIDPLANRQPIRLGLSESAKKAAASTTVSGLA